MTLSQLWSIGLGFWDLGDMPLWQGVVLLLGTAGRGGEVCNNTQTGFHMVCLYKMEGIEILQIYNLILYSL